MLLQIPGVDIPERMQVEKAGPLNAQENEVLGERTASARAWLESYAPERARLVIQRDAVPAEVGGLDETQKAYFAALASAAEGSRPGSGEAWQALIFRVATDTGLASGRAFGALYAAFLGRSNGPRAGWMLASLDLGFVIERLRAAGQR